MLVLTQRDKNFFSGILCLPVDTHFELIGPHQCCVAKMTWKNEIKTKINYCANNQFVEKKAYTLLWYLLLIPPVNWMLFTPCTSSVDDSLYTFVCLLAHKALLTVGINSCGIFVPVHWLIFFSHGVEIF